MGYSITYGQEPKIKPQPAGRKWIWICAAAVLTLAVCLCAAQPELSGTLRELLFPLTDDVTVEAFQNMVSQVGEGTPVSEAVFGFCREIMDHAY